MYLKCRHSGLYFLLFVITLPCCFGNYFAAQKVKTNIEGLERENKRPIKLSGVDHKTQEDAAQEEGLSLQDIPVVKLVLDKSSKEDNDSQKAKPLAQYTVGTAENTKEEEHENKQENSKNQEPEDKPLKSEENSKEQEPEVKPLKSEENSKEHEHDDKPLKSEENSKEHEHDDKPLKSEQKEQENKSKLDVTEEHESSTVKQSDDNKVTLEEEPSTKCTTDREVTIGKYTPQESQNDDDGPSHDNSHGGDDDGGDNNKSKQDVNNDIGEVTEKTVSKVYKGPRPAKAPDHYIDDI